MAAEIFAGSKIRKNAIRNQAVAMESEGISSIIAAAISTSPVRYIIRLL
jgi:hypothetical protein